MPYSAATISIENVLVADCLRTMLLASQAKKQKQTSAGHKKKKHEAATKKKKEPGKGAETNK